MKVIYRYRTMKPEDGHFQFNLHRDAAILCFAEHWHTEKGWELFIDALENTNEPKESRFFFLCNAGDALDFLGEFPDAYYVGKHETKSYVSYVFETTHLSETERAEGHVQAGRYNRVKPSYDELSRTGRAFEDARRRERERGTGRT